MTTKNNIFGTDGIRAKANTYPMVAEVALALGKAIAYKARSGNHRHKIIVGKDTRLSCYMIENAIVSGICSMGVDAMLLGPIPTAGVAYLTKDMRADAGIMITASHNSFEDNGIKIFDKNGFKLSDEQEQELEDYILGIKKFEAKEDFCFIEAGIGKAFKIDDARGRYIAHVKSVFPSDMDLCGIKIALDCANGAAFRVAPAIFSELGAELVVRNNMPNGTNINDNCGALYPKQSGLVVYNEKCDIGIALDGDADRLVVIDETGKTINGDAILAIAAKELIDRKGSQSIVLTTMSNIALHDFIKGLGGNTVTVDVGDRYVIEEMKKNEQLFGGENSGHLIYSEHSTTGDGMVAALKLLAAMKRENKKLSELASIIKLYPQIMINYEVEKKVPIEEIPSLKRAIDDAYWAMNGQGRVLVRYSGTENKLRIMTEYKDEEVARKAASEILRIAREELR